MVSCTVVLSKIWLLLPDPVTCPVDFLVLCPAFPFCESSGVRLPSLAVFAARCGDAWRARAGLRWTLVRLEGCVRMSPGSSPCHPFGPRWPNAVDGVFLQLFL